MGRKKKVEKKIVKKIEKKIEDVRTFSDFTNKFWFIDGDNIKVGDGFSEIMSGEFEILEIKELLSGEQFNTWRIVITTDDNIYLLKTSKKFK